MIPWKSFATIGGHLSGMAPLQPPPHECQFCGVDLDARNHKPTCRVVTDIDGAYGDMAIPSFLRSKKERHDG